MRLLTLPLLLATGCAPHDGTVTGSYLAYFSDGSSLVLDEITRGRGIDLTEQDNLDRLGLTPVDCRFLEEEDEAKRIPGVDYEAECDFGTPKWFAFFEYYSYYMKTQKISPYRVEAVLTSEHDLQLTVHQNVPRFGDFRFGWVIDPHFQPRVCEDAEGGGSELVEVDGNWLENWSVNEDGGSLYLLNAGSYQTDPTDWTRDGASPDGVSYWYLEQDILAGMAFGRFEDDDFYGRPTDYTEEFNPNYYPDPLYLGTDFPPLLIPPPGRDTYEEWLAEVETHFELTEESPGDLANFGKAPDFPLQVEIEDNSWRLNEDDPEEVEYESTVTGADGLENWIGINTTWVRFDMSPEQLAAIETGPQDKPIKGTFQLQLQGLASASRLFIDGAFSIDHVRKDVWGYSPTLDEIKREENNTPDCGEEPLTETGDGSTI